MCEKKSDLKRPVDKEDPRLLLSFIETGIAAGGQRTEEEERPEAPCPYQDHHDDTHLAAS